MNRRIIISFLALLATACVLLILVMATWVAVFKWTVPLPAALPEFEHHQLYLDPYKEQVAGYYDPQTKEAILINSKSKSISVSFVHPAER